MNDETWKTELCANAGDGDEQRHNRCRLLQAALEEFMAHGYRASTENIARRAGLSRQTLYNHFASKQELFAAVAREASKTLLATLHDEEGSLKERLLRFALHFYRLAQGEVGLKLFRALIAEAPRMPELAQSFFANGPEKSLNALAEMLAGAMARGELRPDDPAFAAEMLFGMLTGVERSRRLCGMATRSAEDEPKHVARIVDLFLHAYRPEGTTHD